ncbi:MAG: hypothetical protein GTO00_10640 [Deltaproteobacteria bacterium]|nr:hypothetical protein [Candidatus Latescibacterota bacterium]NIS78030.1 hypothetical protein [Deltaproteobacteria bacterium]
MNLTDSEKVFYECFEMVAKRPYLGYLVGIALFFIGLGLYSKGMRLDQSGKILLGGLFIGVSLFEIIESYILYRLYTIIEKRKGPEH